MKCETVNTCQNTTVRYAITWLSAINYNGKDYEVRMSEDAVDDEGFITAEVVQYPGIASEGRTAEEALKNVAEALMVYLKGE